MAMQDKPAIMQDLLNYPFWRKTDKDRVRQLGYPVPQASDSDYFERLVDLSHDLANTLKTLQHAAPQPEPPKATVYVAPVHDSLYGQRANLISELRQFGIDALPRNNDVDTQFCRGYGASFGAVFAFRSIAGCRIAYGIPCNQYLTAEVPQNHPAMA